MKTMGDEGRVFIVDDDPDVRVAVRRLVESVGLKAEAFGDARSFLDGYDGYRPACFVFDMRMPGLSGLDLLDEINRRKIDVPVLMVTGFGDVPSAARAFKAGAVDFLEKPFNNQELIDKIQHCLERDRQQQEEDAQRSEICRRRDSLTRREREVLDRVTAGESNRAIAGALGISLRTVEIHRAHVMEKFGANNVVELLTLLDKIK
jgi:FixJ family two-component response regulator